MASSARRTVVSCMFGVGRQGVDLTVIEMVNEGEELIRLGRPAVGLAVTCRRWSCSPLPLLLPCFTSEWRRIPPCDA